MNEMTISRSVALSLNCANNSASANNGALFSTFPRYSRLSPPSRG